MAARTVEIASEIVAVLVPFVVEKKREMTYGELSKAIKEKFGDNVPAWHGMANPLGEIQDACKDLGLPNLPVMVVDQAKLRPAAGWYIQFDLLYPELALLDDVEKRMKARDSVLACEDWSPLYSHYGIEEPSPKAVIDRELELRLYVEGTRQATLKAREEAKRSFAARERCLELRGTACAICGFDSAKVYGVPGIIEVHHLHPLADGDERQTDPAIDLIPVCPNCHRIIHSKDVGIYTPNEVRRMMGLPDIAELE